MARSGSRLTQKKVLSFYREVHRVRARYGDRPPPANEVRQRNRYYYLLRVLADYRQAHPVTGARLELEAREVPLPSDPLEEVLTLAEARRRGWLTIEDLARKLRLSYQTVRKALRATSPPVPYVSAVDGKTHLYRRKDTAAWLKRRWGFSKR
jgi:hypothetical protein